MCLKHIITRDVPQKKKITRTRRVTSIHVITRRVLFRIRVRRQNMNLKSGEGQKKGHHVRSCPNFQGLYFCKCPRAA